MRVPPVLLLLSLLFAGCAAPAATHNDAREATVAPAAHAASDSSPIAFAPPTHLGDVLLGSEPSVAVSTNGTVYVGTPGVGLYRSFDNASTWTGVGSFRCLGETTLPAGLESKCPIQGSDSGKDGGGDTSLVVGPDGTLYHLGLSGSAGNVPFQYSANFGERWKGTKDVSGGDSADRQWIMMDANGVLHASWRDTTLGKIVERHSANKGANWSALQVVTGDGHEGPIAGDPVSGALYLPHVFNGALYVAVSHDGAATWKDQKIRNMPTDTFDFPIAAVDSSGTVYVAYNTDPNVPARVLFDGLAATPHVYLQSSQDGGVTWSAPVQVSPAGVPAMFPWIAAGSAGRVAISWYEGLAPTPSDRTPNVWHVAVAISLNANQATPTFVETDASGGINHVGGICLEGLLCNLSGGDRSMLDFFEIRILPDGSPVLAFAGDSTAYQAFTAVYVTRMVSGPSLYG